MDNDSFKTKQQNMGLLIANLRTKKGMEQHVLASEAGLAAIELAQIEGGKSDPEITTLFAIAEALDISLKDLFK